METLSSDSRQPPDGHEFPDYDETKGELGHNKFGQYTDSKTVTKPGLIKTFKSVECVNSSQNRSSFINDFSSVPMQNKSVLNKINSVSNSDLSSINSKDPYDSCDDAVTFKRTGLEPTLHTRSQSLIDMSTISKPKGDRWSLLAEQRKKGLSKLKGLVIPEHVSENDPGPATEINIPEIRSHITPTFVLDSITSPETHENRHHHLPPNNYPKQTSAMTSPPWSAESNHTTNAIPKYSPAFKRKSLQVYPQVNKNNKIEDNNVTSLQVNNAINKIYAKVVPDVKSNHNNINNNNNHNNVNGNVSNSATATKVDSDELRLDNLSDAPKSLESITSPTRSDCSFDYITNSYGKTSKYTNNGHNNNNINNKVETVNAASRVSKESPNFISRLHKDLGKSEDESDNDSAVSSSQSSYISRCSPPPSPTRSCEMLDYDSNLRQKSDDCRLLKPASVEAINRKNILASAKCRSGRDLKVGSPIIQRKYEDDDSLNTSSIETDNSISNQSSPSPNGKQEFECNLTDSPPIVMKEKRSISCEETNYKEQEREQEVEKTKQDLEGLKKSPPINRIIEEKKQNDVVAPPRKVETHTPFITLKPVALRRNSVETKDTKIAPKSDAIKTSSYLSKKQSMSVTDLRKSFEKFGSAPPPLPNSNVSVKEVRPKSDSKLKTPEKILSDRRTSRGEDVAKLETAKTKPNLLRKPVEQQKGEKQAAAASEDGHNRREVVLRPEFVGGSIGITLAGGTDYETKEITVHRIRYGSAAYNEGGLKKGDKVISINGRSTIGLTHAESVEMLKEAVATFVLVVEDGKEPTSAAASPQRKSFIYDPPEPKNSTPEGEKKVTNIVNLIKDGGGLGFSIEGGKDSLQGDLPLRIKKIFQGGCAEKSGELRIGDVLLTINESNLVNMSRIEAWSLMKKLPDGRVCIHIHR